MGTRKIKGIHIGEPKLETLTGRSLITGMDKQTVQNIYLSHRGFTGDGVGNLRHHGGSDRAVCFYPNEHYLQWEQEFDKVLKRPAFGENLTVSGMKESEVYFGDIYQIGTSIVEICQGRIPCATISDFNDVPTFLKRTMETGYTGYFARVIEEGTIEGESDIILKERVQEAYTIERGNRILLHNEGNQADIEGMLKLDSLADDWKKRVEKKQLALMEQEG